MRPFVDYCNSQRQNAETDFESGLYKLLPNSFFGKTCENLRKRVNMRFITDPKKLKSYVKKHVRHEQYLHVLKNWNNTTCKFRTFKSSHREITTREMTKICLSCIDDKRYLLPDGISSLPYGPDTFPSVLRVRRVTTPQGEYVNCSRFVVFFCYERSSRALIKRLLPSFFRVEMADCVLYRLSVVCVCVHCICSSILSYDMSLCCDLVTFSVDIIACFQ